jgi:tetratricopeptide (TPR) repeat protein
MDFQKIIVIEPVRSSRSFNPVQKNPMVHIYAGNLLMTTGSYEDATKAFTNADNIEKSALALYQRARCHVALNNMSEALKDLNKVIEIANNDKIALADRECLNALKLASGKENQTSCHDKSVYEKALTPLTKLIQAESNENLAKITHESSVAHHHSQLIPSANRTKTDKIRAARRRKEQDRLVKDGKSKRNDLRFRVHHEGGDPVDQDEDDYEDISDLDQDEI